MIVCILAAGSISFAILKGRFDVSQRRLVPGLILHLASVLTRSTAATVNLGKPGRKTFQARAFLK